MTNFKCPHCGSDRTKKNGIDRSGVHPTQRYLCNECGKTFGGGKIGRPPSKGKYCIECGAKQSSTNRLVKHRCVNTCYRQYLRKKKNRITP